MHKLRLWIKKRGLRVVTLFVFFIVVSLVTEKHIRKYVAIERENFFLKQEQTKIISYVSLLEKQSHTLIKQNETCFNDSNREALEVIASAIHLRMLLIKTSQNGRVELNMYHCHAVRQRMEGLITTILQHEKFTKKQKMYLLEIVNFEGKFFANLCAKALDKI
tara:strand:+ start:782 stop:1270 length:489 start_codon:yes stop_codon:yes gene_type:complete